VDNMGKAWRKFRTWPLWGQIVAWVVAGFILLGIIGALLPSEDKTSDSAPASSLSLSGDQPASSQPASSEALTSTAPPHSPGR
jgi:hypothetical protein